MWICMSQQLFMCCQRVIYKSNVMSILDTITHSPRSISVTTTQFITRAFVLPAMACHFSSLDTEENPMK